jgi:uncharacterized repeat protein (TIGR02059 family)
VVEFDSDLLAEPVTINGVEYLPFGSTFLQNSWVQAFSPGDGQYVTLEPASAVVRGDTLRITFPTIDWSDDNNSQVAVSLAADQFYTAVLAQPSGAQMLFVPNPGVDTIAPPFESAELDASGTALTLTFEEDLKADSVPDTGTLTVTAGLTTVPVSSIVNSGATSVLTLATAIPQETVVTVSYDAPDAPAAGFEDAVGNRAVDFTNKTVTNNSTYVPDVTSPQLLEGTAPSLASNGTALTLTFDETLAAASGTVKSAFTVTADGSEVSVSSVANSDATSVLTLGSAVLEGARVTVSYTKPDSGGLQDAAGNEVATFAAQTLTNNSEQEAESSGPTGSGESSESSGSTESGQSGESDSSESSEQSETATTEPETASTTPTLVTEENQAALTATAGTAKMLVNGEEVELTLTSTGADDAGAVAPEERTAEQVAELQEAADGLIERIDEAAGGDSGLEVVDTDTGAEIDGIFDDTRVPVEDVIIAESTEFTGLYASRDEDGNPNQIRAEMLEMERGGEVAVFVYGLPAGEDAELVLMSTPYLLGTATADANGNFTRVLSPPEAVLAGDHTLVTVSDTLSVSLGIRITDPAVAVPAEAELPATGRGLPLAPVVLLIGVGALLVTFTRQRDRLGS